MKKSRFTEEQVAYALRQSEAGTPAECCATIICTAHNGRTPRLASIVLAIGPVPAKSGADEAVRVPLIYINL